MKRLFAVLGLWFAVLVLLLMPFLALAQSDTTAPTSGPTGGRSGSDSSPARPTAPGTAEQAAPSIDPRIAVPAIEAMQATIKLRDAQLVVVHERVRQLEAELKDAQAKAASAPPAAPPAPPKPAK